jgi:hypothetical protein
MQDPLTIEYFREAHLFHNRQAMESVIRVELFSGSIQPKQQEFPIKDFQNF